MKIGIITDLHIGHYEGKENDFKNFLSTLRVDLLVVAGDIVSSKQSEMEDALRLIRESDPYLDVVLVRGNHCFWVADRPFDSVVDIDDYHKELFKKYNIHYLQNNKYENDDVIIYGFDGWYRYSNTGTNDISMMPNNSGMGELTPFQYLQRAEGKAIDYILDDIEKNPSDKKKMIVTHFNLICDNPAYERMSGNTRYLDILAPEVDYLIFGHTHQKYSKEHHGCLVMNVGADYDLCPRLDLYYEELIINKE